MRSLLRWFFRALSLLAGVPLALLLAAGGIGPDDALSNLAKWARVLGIDHIPQWFTALIINSRLFWVALSALFLYFVLMIVISYFPRPTAIGIAGFCFVSVPAVSWVLLGNPTHIYIECTERSAPLTFPSDGNIHNITIYNRITGSPFSTYLAPARVTVRANY